MERYVKVKQVSELLDVSPKTIYYWAHIELIPHYKLPKGLRFKSSEIERWMNRRKQRGRVNYRLDMEN